MNQSKTNSDKKFSKGKPSPKSSNSKPSIAKTAKSSNKTYNSQFDLRNADKKNKNFMYQNVAGGKCHRCDFSESNFDFASFRGAAMKDCKFKGCSFKGTEFIGTNFKDSDFTNATFENCIFEGAKLVDVNFMDATFINTIFLFTDTSVAKNLDLENKEITVYSEMPEIDLSDAFVEAYEEAMTNKFIKKSRVLDTKEGKLNNVSVMRLLEYFDESTLTKGLVKMSPHLDRDFYTLSFIVTLIKKLQKNEEI